MQRCRLPTNLSGDKLVGDLHISTLDDGKLCSLLAENQYDPDLGARSLAHAVTDDIMVPLVDAFLDHEEGLGRGPRADVAIDKYSVQIDHDEKTDESQIKLRRDGETRLKSVVHKVDEPLFSTQESWTLLDQGSFTMREEDAGADAARNSEVLCEYSPHCLDTTCTFRHPITLRYTPGSDRFPITCKGCGGEHNTAMCLVGKFCLSCGLDGHVTELCPKKDA